MANSEEHELKLRTSGKRFVELDSLRGIAAFTVIWHHFRLAFYAESVGRSGWKGIITTPLFAGHQAVMLFFVLSGFVLAMPFAKGKSSSYRVYLVRRFLRIYVPFLIALVFAWVCATRFVNVQLPLTQWYYGIWHTPLTAKAFVEQLPISTTGTINTAFWSLRYEMELSIVFPMIIAFVLRFGKGATCLLICALYGGAALLDGTEIGITLQYAPLFVYGALLSTYRVKLQCLYDRLSSALRVIVFLLAIAFFYAGGRLNYPQRLHIGNALIGFAAGVILLYAMFSRRFSTILRLQLPEYLGRISYSLYLVHGTVLIVTLDILYGRVSMPVIVLVYLMACMATAHVFCSLVEEPAIQASKWLAMREKSAVALARSA